MKTLKQGLAFFVPAAIAAFLFLGPRVKELGHGNLSDSTGIAAAGIAFIIGACCLALYLKLSRRK